MLTDYDVIISLYFNILIWVVGNSNGGGRASLAPICATFFTFLPTQV